MRVSTGAGADSLNLNLAKDMSVTSVTGAVNAIDVNLGSGDTDSTIVLAGAVQGMNLTATAGRDQLDMTITEDGSVSALTSGDAENQKYALGIDLGSSSSDSSLIDLSQDGTVAGLRIATGAAADKISIVNDGTITHNVGAAAVAGLLIDTNGGQDEINMTLVGGVENMLLRGGQGADAYLFNIFDTATGDIEIDDDIATDEDSAGNSLVIHTKDADDKFLFRNDLLYRYDVQQRIDYAGFTALSLYTYGGDDTFIFDDTNVLVTVDAGDGDDVFQLGQMYQSPRDTFAGLAEEDSFVTTLTTKGYLSNGVSAGATLFGGAGNDSFTVLSNKASIKLEGGADDDSFLVRSFVMVDPNDPLAPITNINGGDGADFISYAVNAPVRISGGDGLDSLTVVGTEFADDYAITDAGIYGAGRYTAYDGIEEIIVDGLEGNDNFFVFSTPANASVKLIGGMGSDTFNVGDGPVGQAVEVVADDLLGHNSLIEHTVGDITRTLSANVLDEDEAAVHIIPLTGTTLFEDDGTGTQDGSVFGAYAYVQYAVVLSRPPKGVVSFSAVPSVAADDSDDSSLNDASIEFPKNITLNGSNDGVSLLFDKSNWYQQQIITVRAPVDSTAYNGGVEGIQPYEILHSIVEDGALDGDDYDGVQVNPFVVTVVDADTSNVVVMPIQKQLTVLEQDAAQAVANPGVTDGFDTYELVLSKQPASDVTINIEPFVDPNTGAQLRVVDPITKLEVTSVTFTDSNWFQPVKLLVQAIDDNVTDDGDLSVEGIHYSRINHTVTTADVGYQNLHVAPVDVRIGDNEVADLIFLESNGGTTVIEEAQEVVFAEGQMISADTDPGADYTFTGTFGLCPGSG